MAVTYKKLFHLMIDKGMSNAELMEQAGFSANIITRLKRDNYLSLDTIEKICNTHSIAELMIFLNLYLTKKAMMPEILSARRIHDE